MKTLILLRHAKSSWVNPDLADMDRPLNKRGRRSAKALGKWLRKSQWQPDMVLCSPARRTRETWEGLGLAAEIRLDDRLYHAPQSQMLEVLRQSNDDIVMMIGHNPGTASFAHTLVSEAPEHPRFADWPTGALMIARFDADTWREVAEGAGTVVSFLTPHDLVRKE